MFELPESLPTTVTELDTLLETARRHIRVIQARHAAGEDMSPDDVDEMNRLVDAVKVLAEARTAAVTAEEAHAADVQKAIDRAAEATAEEAEEPVEETPAETSESSEDEPVAEATPEPVAAASTPVTFGGLGANDVPQQQGPGWEMDPSCPGYRNGMGRIGFAELALALDTVRPGSRTRNRPNKTGTGSAFSSQVLARLQRDVPLVEDSHELVAQIKRVTNELPGRPGERVTAEALTAAGGWCAPSEQLYTFCDVPDATDLVSLPEITIVRGGIRWPVEPDLSAIFESFEFFFTEPELEAVGSGDGEPTAVKNCVEIPCVDDYEEIRLNAVGYCVEAGILQTQGWPELIEWFMRSIVQEHLRALSRRTITDMVNGSTAVAIPEDAGFGVVSSALNSLALMAYNLRGERGLARNATIEGVAPNWFAEVLRADLAMQEGLDTKAVGDAQITSWLTSRNISLQFVGDWQTRTAGLPGHLETVVWPDSVNVLLYPAGTWFRSMSNVIELGVQYPKEELQVNRYTRFFTEDAIAVGHRCNHSLNVTVPICVNGAISERVAITCGTGGSVA